MITNTYNYYLTTYYNRELTKYDTHKKSELKNIYKSIVQLSKRSPLFEVKATEDLQKYVIDLKENSRILHNVAASLSSDEVGKSGFTKKTAASSNPDVLTARFVGDDDVPSDASYKIEVQNLAEPQVNTGYALDPDILSASTGSYSFDLNIGDYTYEFQFQVKDDDTNASVQQKVNHLINRSSIGVRSSIITDKNGNTALQLTSDSTGVPENRNIIFSVSSSGSDNDAIQYLGLNRITNSPADASFRINGSEKTASSNTFTVNKTFEVTLQGVTPENESTEISFKPDVDSILENVSNLINSYNSVIDFAGKPTLFAAESNRLFRDLSSIAKNHQNTLDSAGLTVQPDGKIQLDESLLVQSISEGSFEDTLDELDNFKKELMAKANKISLNPMDYVKKKMISYPNPISSKVFPNPYVTSIYSGMMFDGYL